LRGRGRGEKKLWVREIESDLKLQAKWWEPGRNVSWWWGGEGGAEGKLHSMIDCR